MGNFAVVLGPAKDASSKTERDRHWPRAGGPVVGQTSLKTVEHEDGLPLKEVQGFRWAEEPCAGLSTSDALVTAEARLRLVMQAANIGFWDWDVKTNSVYHSPEWKRQLGYEDRDISNAIGEWQSRLHPEDQARVQSAVAAFLAEPRCGYDLEFRLRHRDGSYRWIHSQGLLLRDHEGKPARLLGVHVDITTSKTREEQLRRSEERFRHLVEATSIIPWAADADGHFTYAGPRAVGILGYPVEEWLRPGFWVNHLHAEDRAAAVAFRQENAARCRDYESEYRMLGADGQVVWFHDVVHVVHGSNGPEGLHGFLIDITERRQAAEEHARLAAIVEWSNDAIVGENLDGIITSWNKSAQRIYGYSAEEAVGRSVRMLVPRDRAEETTDILNRLKRGEIIEPFETVRVRRDGKVLHVSLVVSPIQDLNGKVVGASAIARDISQRKQLETEVLQISEREQQRIAQDLHDGLGQLLSGTVHLSNALQLELTEQALPEAAEAMRITELLNQAVSDARSLARGLYPVRPEAHGFMAALSELVSRTKELFHVACSFEYRQPVLIGDNALATHLYRIAQEAVTNALKHGHAKRLKIVLHPPRAAWSSPFATMETALKPTRSRGAGWGFELCSTAPASSAGNCFSRREKNGESRSYAACRGPRLDYGNEERSHDQHAERPAYGVAAPDLDCGRSSDLPRGPDSVDQPGAGSAGLR